MKVTLSSSALLIALAMTALLVMREPAQPVVGDPPATLRETGLYADWSAKTVAPINRPFTPQYPLWSDGARKQRWIYVPGVIDATQPDAWQFPLGTRIWKEFSFGRRTETRYMVHTAAGWRYATYVWTMDETDAVLASPAGTPSIELRRGVRHHIPSEADCRACHAGAQTPVLGFSALQLSVDRDPGAVHREPMAPGSIDLAELVVTKGVRGIADPRPRIPGSPAQRAALGYLHGNCGNCHGPGGALASLGLVLAHSLRSDDEPATLTTIDQPSAFMAPGKRVVAGDPTRSVMLARMQSRVPVVQMPPLGTQLVDDEATRLVADWIAQLAHSQHRENGEQR